MKLQAKIDAARNHVEKLELARYGRILSELERSADLFMRTSLAPRAVGMNQAADWLIDQTAGHAAGEFLQCLIDKNAEGLRKLAKFVESWKPNAPAHNDREYWLLTLAEMSRVLGRPVADSIVAQQIGCHDERQLKKLKARHGFVKGKPGRPKKVSRFAKK